MYLSPSLSVQKICECILAGFKTEIFRRKLRSMWRCIEVAFVLKVDTRISRIKRKSLKPENCLWYLSVCAKWTDFLHLFLCFLVPMSITSFGFKEAAIFNNCWQRQILWSKMTDDSIVLRNKSARKNFQNHALIPYFHPCGRFFEVLTESLTVSNVFINNKIWLWYSALLGLNVNLVCGLLYSCYIKVSKIKLIEENLIGKEVQ